MGEPILCYGKSGSGKSRSLKNFAEDEILLVNVISKRMPFQKQFKYVLKSRNYNTIKNQLMKMPCKVAVIDDAGYLQTSTFMEGHSTPKKGASTFDLFNQIGDEFWDLILFVKEQLPEDVFVYFLMHEISNDYGEVKVRTIGKMLDNYVTVEGRFTIVMKTVVQDGRYLFSTQNNGQDTVKTPMGLFDKPLIDNDLKAVDLAIREYWEMDGGEENA